jgi:hypothetical protein
MRKPIYILFLIVFFSCQNKSLKTELKNAYTISAENEKDTLEIEKFEILKTENVDFEFVQRIRINNLKHMIYVDKLIIENCEKIIELKKHNILNRTKMIELDGKNKDKYLKQVEYDQQKLENNKIKIEEKENEIAITHQRIVLIQAEFKQNKNKYEVIDYVFRGKINNVIRIDTMSILKNSENTIKFVKNKMFTDYRGK